MILKTPIMFAAILIASAVTIPIRADIVVDQSQLDGTVLLQYSDFPNLIQSFQQDADNITGASVLIHPDFGSGTADVTIGVYDDLPNMGGNLLGEGTVEDVGAGEFAVVDFGGQVSVTPGETLFLLFSGTNPTLGFAGAQTTTNPPYDPYPEGIAYGTRESGEFLSFPSLDWSFETFAEGTIQPVPEPTSLALLGIGASIAGIGASIRRRRKRDQA